MLGRLIKYEWKNTAKVCGSLLLFMGIMTVLGCVSFCTPLWSGVFKGEGSSPMIFLGIMFLVLYVVSLIGVIYGILIYLGVHFYKSMYSDEGYLTHTLPVTSHHLLVSKILVSALWYLIVMVLMFVSLVSIVLTVIHLILAAEGRSFWAELSDNWDFFVMGVESVMGEGILKQILFYILQIVVAAFSSVMMLFGAITVGQLSSRHKVMMSIVSYFGITILLQIVASIVTVPVTFYSTQAIMESAEVSVNLTTMPTFLVTIAMNLIFAVVLYFISNFIITRKLNLD